MIRQILIKRHLMQICSSSAQSYPSSIAVGCRSYHAGSNRSAEMINVDVDVPMSWSKTS